MRRVGLAYGSDEWDSPITVTLECVSLPVWLNSVLGSAPLVPILSAAGSGRVM